MSFFRGTYDKDYIYWGIEEVPLLMETFRMACMVSMGLTEGNEQAGHISLV